VKRDECTPKTGIPDLPRVRFLIWYSFLVALSSLLIGSLFLIVSCGRKGPPTLKAYAKPEAASQLTAIHREDRVSLSWTYPSNLRETLKGFVVLRSEGGGAFERIGFQESDQTSFADETFKTDVAYKYKVVAQSLKGVSGNDSNIIAIIPKPLPAPPEGIRFKVKSDSIELSWKSSGEGICYNIYRSFEKGKYGEASLNGKPECATSFGDGRLIPDKTVYYSIRALHSTDSRDEGYPSSEVSVGPSDFLPAPPTDLRVVKDNKVYLLWKESPETWVRGYRVYRKREDEKEFSLLGEVKAPAYTDTEKTDKKVWYMIRALGPEKESEPSAEVQ